MKKSKSTFKIFVICSFLLAISSCASVYIAKDYSGSQCYQIVDEYLQTQGWGRTVESEKIVYIKGENIQLTIDYESEGLEVQIHLEKMEGDTFEVSVGNWGMVGEIHLMKSRFERLSSKLDEKIKEKCHVENVALFLHQHREKSAALSIE
jgi:hypothetical protein